MRKTEAFRKNTTQHIRPFDLFRPCLLGRPLNSLVEWLILSHLKSYLKSIAELLSISVILSASIFACFHFSLQQIIFRFFAKQEEKYWTIPRNDGITLFPVLVCHISYVYIHDKSWINLNRTETWIQARIKIVVKTSVRK